jgi:hypothetical protein
MNRLSKIWTASIAYVALAVGAGASIMFNILDTAHVRGQLFDVWDLIMAILAPGMVVLMVEMFVSRLWSDSFASQLTRWSATMAIGGVAMRVSWTHGHDFLLSRGQATDVAALWPLSIDLLAVMATGLLLAGRRTHLAEAMLPVQDEIGASQPIDPDFQAWTEELAIEPISPAPIETEPKQRAPRARWDARRVCELALDGAKASVATEATGIGASTYARYLAAARILQSDPRAAIEPARKVPVEHVAILRELVTR